MKHSSRRLGLARATTLAAIAGAAVLMACEARIPTAAEVDNMDVAAVERAAVQSKLIQGSSLDSVRFYVNEVRVSEAEAKQLSANSIATVGIRKGAGAKEVWITKLDSAKVASLEPAPVAGMLLRTMRDSGAAPVVVPAGTGLRMKSRTTNAQVYIDGVKSSSEALSRLDRNSIESVEVVKGATAGRLYGDSAGTTGVILVKTKTP